MGQTTGKAVGQGSKIHAMAILSRFCWNSVDSGRVICAAAIFQGKIRARGHRTRRRPRLENSSSPKPSRALPAFFDSLRAAEAARRKKEEQTPQAVLHTDRGSVYSSRAFCQEYEHYNFRSMSRKGTPNDNPILEARNGWMKEKLYLDFGLATSEKFPFILGYICT